MVSIAWILPRSLTQSPSRLGVAVEDATSSEEDVFLEADTYGPMQSVFKAPLGAVQPHRGSVPAVNDGGIITLADGRKVLLAILLSKSTAPDAERDRVHADVAGAVLRNLS